MAARARLVVGPSILCALVAAAPAATAQRLLVVVRHAERVDESPDAALSPQGQQRARRLAALLRDAGITAVFTSELERTVRTAQPLATAQKLAIARVDGRKTDELVQRIRKEHADGRVLVVGHSNTVPAILEAYGLERPPDIPRQEYDNVWILVPTARGPATVVRLRY